MSSPEMEGFKMTEDDMEDIRNPLRKRGKMSKNQSIYGIWADSDDEDGGRIGFGGSRKKIKDYTAPVNFVSGGVKIGDKVTKVEDEDEKDDITDSDEEEEKPVPIKKTIRRDKGGLRAMKNELGTWERHTKGIGQKLLEKMGHVPGKGLGKNLQGISTPVEAVQRKGRGAIGLYGNEKSERAEVDFPTKPDSEGEEEKEFQKKMRRWKKGEGKSKPTKTRYFTAGELLKSKAGKPYVGKTGTSDISSDFANVKVIDMTGKEQRILTGYQALSTRHAKPPTEDEDDEVVPANMPKLFEMPELLHNLDLLVDMTEDKIIRTHKKIKYEEDLLINLEHECQRLDDICRQDEYNVNRLEEVIGIIEEFKRTCSSSSSQPSFSSSSPPPPPSSSSYSSSSSSSSSSNHLTQCMQLINRLQSDYEPEYLLYDLSNEVLNIALPLLSKEFESWDALRNPKHGTDLMLSMKQTLSSSHAPYQSDASHYGHMTNQVANHMDPYDKLVWDLVVPMIRLAVRNWDVRDPNPMLELLEHWLPLMQSWMVTSLLDQFIYPKLQMQINDWNPLTDTIPIHTWTQPWLFIMGDRLSNVYPTIRQKLGNALSKWHPSDPSAKLILQPWVGVFQENHMDVFLVKHILPKLALCLRELDINPQHQQLEPWNWVMSWHDMIPTIHLASALRENFFPKWLRVLGAWLVSSDVKFDDVTNWYTNWKKMIPEKLVADVTVRECLREALMMLNKAVVGTSNHMTNQPGARENMAYFISNERRKEIDEGGSSDRDKQRSSSDNYPYYQQPQQPTNLKERLVDRCQERGVVFLPAANKIHDGKQVYRAGRLLLYFDRGLMFYYEDSRWVATSNMELIIDKAG